MTLADRIRAARLDAGLTQAEAAARMPSNVTFQYWSDVENGRRNPSLEWLWEAAHALGCNPNRLDHRLASVRPKRP
jgi:transcriptional regulator with XRE-family HTH domain